MTSKLMQLVHDWKADLAAAAPIRLVRKESKYGGDYFIVMTPEGRVTCGADHLLSRAKFIRMCVKEFGYLPEVPPTAGGRYEAWLAQLLRDATT